jgi:hypothetical protein
MFQFILYKKMLKVKDCEIQRLVELKKQLIHPNIIEKHKTSGYIENDQHKELL